MKVSTKIVAGYGALVLLMASGFVYELVLVQRMQESNQRMAEVNLEAATVVRRLDENLRNVEDFAIRLFTLGGDPYPARLTESSVLFDQELRALAELVSSERERGALTRLDSLWNEFGESVAAAEAARPESGAYTEFPVRLGSELRQLEAQIAVLSRAFDETREVDAVRSIETGRQAQRVSWIVAVAALGLAAGVGFSVVRSTSRSFRRFMEATRSVAEGRFTERLPEHRTDEFGELARSFNAMARRLEELDRLKNDFVSSVSHEIKSPIASSREIVQLLLDGIPGPLNGEQRRLLELSIRSSRRLSSMVGGLLDLARMDAGTMTYAMRRCDLKDLVERTIEEFEVALEDRGLRIATDFESPAEMVYCDRDRIVQVVGNLIDNAMKFSKRGSAISVRLARAAAGAGRAREVVLSVVDSGPGVPDRDKRRIFAKFQQAGTDGSKHKGVGLGLAISRSIIEAHGGRIWVEDNPAGGAMFRFTLASFDVGQADAARSVQSRTSR